MSWKCGIDNYVLKNIVKNRRFLHCSIVLTTLSRLRELSFVLFSLFKKWAILENLPLDIEIFASGGIKYKMCFSVMEY